MEDKRQSLEMQEGDTAAQRKTQGALFAEEVKVWHKLLVSRGILSC